MDWARLPGVMIVSAFFVISNAHADVTVMLDPGPGADFASEFGFSLDELEMRLGSEIEEAFNVVNPKEYLEAFADAEAFSAKGLGADYASDPDLFSVGVAVNFTAAVGEDGFSGDTDAERLVTGVAPNIALMAGVNVGKLLRVKSLERLMVYANGFHVAHNFHEDFKGSRTTFGAHAQYKLIKGPEYPGDTLLGWGGLTITSGVQFGRLKLSLKRDLETDIEIDEIEQAGGSLRLVSTGTARFTSTSISIPLEATTSVRLLYVLSLYGGLGIDVFLGNSKMDVELAGQFTGNDGNGNEMDVGTATIQVEESSGPRPGRLRFLGGLQLNLSMVGIFGQVNVAPDRALGATLGVRVAW